MVRSTKTFSSPRGQWACFRLGGIKFFDVVVVGARNWSPDEFSNDSIAEPGSVYIFERQENDVWSYFQNFPPNGNGSDAFGLSVSVSADVLVVGQETIMPTSFNVMSMVRGKLGNDYCPPMVTPLRLSGGQSLFPVRPSLLGSNMDIVRFRGSRWTRCRFFL